jgi:hypothetical protein
MTRERWRFAQPVALRSALRDFGRSDTAEALLLLVALDDVFAAQLRDAGVLARVAAGAALSQEIPILIEPNRDRIETRPIIVAQLSVLAVFEQVVFFVN